MIRLTLACALLACIGTAQAAPQLEPDDRSLTPAQAEATRQLLADAVQRLPAAWADALDQRIEVEWRDDLPAQVHGRAQARRLLLDRALLDGWMARPRDAGIDDPATRAALSVLIRELAHFYDRTPQGRLQRAGIADSTVLEDRIEAMRLGYYFEASSARYDAMFDVARQALQLPQSNAQDWLDLPAGERAPWLARDELKRRFLGRDADRGTDGKAALVAVRDVLQMEGFLSRPATLLPGTGYGLPQDDERETLTQESNRHAAQWRLQSGQLRSVARQWLPPERQVALDATEANVDALGVQLRRLHQEEGGLPLR